MTTRTVVLGALLVTVLTSVTACSATTTPVATRSTVPEKTTVTTASIAASTAVSTSAVSTSAVSSSPATATPGNGTTLDCSGPIGVYATPTPPSRTVLGAVGLDTSSTLSAADSPAGPHRLFAKTGLFVKAGRTATIAIPADWTSRASIAWGNGSPVWTTRLEIPSCPLPDRAQGEWLVFPGGYSVDAPACLPLEIRSGTETRTIDVSVGEKCPR